MIGFPNSRHTPCQQTRGTAPMQSLLSMFSGAPYLRSTSNAFPPYFATEIKENDEARKLLYRTSQEERRAFQQFYLTRLDDRIYTHLKYAAKVKTETEEDSRAFVYRSFFLAVSRQGSKCNESKQVRPGMSRSPKRETCRPRVLCCGCVLPP
jgi:hypothetical protein